MTAENTSEEAANERLNQRNLSIQGDVDESTVIVGAQNTIHQGASYHTTNIIGNIVGAFDTEQLRLQQIRRLLLKQMRTNVAQRLEDSLHNLVRVDLAQEEQRYQVGRRRKAPLVELTPTSTQGSYELIQRQLAVSNSDEGWEPIAPAEQTYNIFHRYDIGGRLLILGEPGAGKTTELLTISQRLVEEAIQDNDKPIPLIFELSKWTPNTPILVWVGQQLKKSYGVSKKLAEPLATQWVQKSQILPMLDGLDELGQRNQVVCIKALEEFLAQYPALSMLICCRREDYEQGKRQLQQLNGAIYLQSAGHQQIHQYLKDLGREQLWQGIQAEPSLLKLAQSPLFLTMLVIAYQGEPIRDKSSLFSAYIQKQLHDPSHQGTYKPGKEKSPEQTLHYLGWLARQLKERNETEFLIENLQPDWLETTQSKRTYRLLLGLGVWLFFGIIGGLIFWQTGNMNEWIAGWIGAGLYWNICLQFIPVDGSRIKRMNTLNSENLIQKSNGQPHSFINLAVVILIRLYQVYLSIIEVIKPTEQLKWSFHNGLVSGVYAFLSGGLLIGGCFGLLSGLRYGPGHGLLGGVTFGLIGGLISGFCLGLYKGLDSEEIQQKYQPNQGIQKSLLNGLVGGLVGGLVSGLVSGLVGTLFVLIIDVLADEETWIFLNQIPNEKLLSVLWSFWIHAFEEGLILGFFFGLPVFLWGLLIGGWWSVMQHFSLRICLIKNGDIPWNYAQFLEHAARHRLIQRTGGRYRFVHNLLRQHFVQMTPQQQAVLAQHSEDQDTNTSST